MDTSVGFRNQVNSSFYMDCLRKNTNYSLLQSYPIVPGSMYSRERDYQRVQVSRSSKPGPKPNRCIWCNEVQCNHCQCPGYAKCDHKNGEPCSRHRYDVLRSFDAM